MYMTVYDHYVQCALIHVQFDGNIYTGTQIFSACKNFTIRALLCMMMQWYLSTEINAKSYSSNEIEVECFEEMISNKMWPRQEHNTHGIYQMAEKWTK